MPRQSKLDRISEIQSTMGEFDLSDAQSVLAELAQAAENANDAIQMIVGAAEQAAGAHEDRDWEGRNDSLEEIPDHLETLSEALDALENLDQEFVSTILATVSQVRMAATTVSDSADALIEV